MFRATISMPDEMAKYLESTGKKTSESIQDIIADYQFARLYADSEMKEEEKEPLEKALQEELFKVQRLFDAENNRNTCLAMVAVIEWNKMPFTKEMGILCIDQFLDINPVCRRKYGNRIFFKKCLCERMIENYLDEKGIVQLKEYQSYIAQADKLELRMRKDEVQEVFAYKGGELIDYIFGDEMRLSTFKSRLERKTGVAWEITDKEAGNTDCSLIRK